MTLKTPILGAMLLGGLGLWVPLQAGHTREQHEASPTGHLPSVAERVRFTDEGSSVVHLLGRHFGTRREDLRLEIDGVSMPFLILENDYRIRVDVPDWVSEESAFSLFLRGQPVALATGNRLNRPWVVESVGDLLLPEEGDPGAASYNAMVRQAFGSTNPVNGLARPEPSIYMAVRVAQQGATRLHLLGEGFGHTAAELAVCFNGAPVAFTLVNDQCLSLELPANHLEALVSMASSLPPLPGAVPLPWTTAAHPSAGACHGCGAGATWEPSRKSRGDRACQRFSAAPAPGDRACPRFRAPRAGENPCHGQVPF